MIAHWTWRCINKRCFQLLQVKRRLRFLKNYSRWNFILNKMYSWELYTLKTPGSDLTRKRVPWGQTHSWVRLIWNPGKNDRNLSPKCLSDSDSGSVRPGFRVRLTPKWVWAPRTLFRVKSDPGVFRVYRNNVQLDKTVHLQHKIYAK